MAEDTYPAATPEIAARRGQLAPEIGGTAGEDQAADRRGGRARDSVPLLHQGTHKLARRKGASPEEIMEAIWVASEMRAGGAYAHSTLALHAMGEGAPEPT